MKKVLLVIIAFTVLSCNPGNTNNKDTLKDSTNSTVNSTESNSIEQPIVCERIYNNDFAIKPFGFKIKENTLKSDFSVNFSVEKKNIKNPHEQGVVDTVVYYRYHTSFLKFYKTATKTFFQQALLKDDLIELSKGIKVGMLKDDFLKKFNSRATKDTICVSDDEETYQHYFIFNKDKLSEITINMYVD